MRISSWKEFPFRPVSLLWTYHLYSCEICANDDCLESAVISRGDPHTGMGCDHGRCKTARKHY